MVGVLKCGNPAGGCIRKILMAGFSGIAGNHLSLMLQYLFCY